MRRLLFFFMLALVLPIRAIAAPQITWVVDNPFRLFNYDTFTQAKSKIILDRMALTLSIEAAYADLAKQLRADRFGVGEPLYQFTAYERRYGIYDPAYLFPKAQHIVARLTAPIAGDSSCDWVVDGDHTPQDCSKPFKLDVRFDPESYHARVNISVQTASGTYSAAIDSQDRLVLGLGDSYAAGEGNPDRPADLTRVRVPLPFYKRPTDWWRPFPNDDLNAGVLPRLASADWWSNECHRSLFSPQVLAAIKLAAVNLHQSITFVSFACSGASVLDGLVAPQESPPGEARIESLGEAGADHHGPAYDKSQLRQAVEALCAYQPTDMPIPGYDPSDYPIWDNIYYKLAHHSSAPSYPGCQKWLRKPDVIMITIGGNDVGFAGLGAWALAPLNLGFFDKSAISLASTLAWNHLGFVCPSSPFQYLDPDTGRAVRDDRCTLNGASGNAGAKDLIDAELPGLLRLSARALVESGLGEKAIVIHESYPSPFEDETGQICGRYKLGAEFESPTGLEEIWRALDVVVVLVNPRVDQVRAKALDTNVLPLLNRQIDSSDAANGWITAPPADYARHGYCSGSGNLKADFGFPEWLSPSSENLTGGWDDRYPIPSTWDAYRPARVRWLRNASDSVLTEMVSNNSGAALIESLSGTLHPTAAGEASVADQIFDVIPTPIINPLPPAASFPIAPPAVTNQTP